MGPGFGFDFMFSIFPFFFIIIFVIVIGTFIVTAVKGIKTWNYNNSQPVLTVQAKVVSKRANVSSHMHSNAGGAGYHHHSSTSYYATFEVESGDRMELHIDGSEYGMLAEADFGKLTFQGTRYLGFKRE